MSASAPSPSEPQVLHIGLSDPSECGNELLASENHFTLSGSNNSEDFQPLKIKPGEKVSLIGNPDLAEGWMNFEFAVSGMSYDNEIITFSFEEILDAYTKACIRDPSRELHTLHLV